MAGPGDIPGAPQEEEEDSGAKQSLNNLSERLGQRVGPGSAASDFPLLWYLPSWTAEGRGSRGQTAQCHIHWSGSEVPEKGHKNGLGEG